MKIYGDNFTIAGTGVNWPPRPALSSRTLLDMIEGLIRNMVDDDPKFVDLISAYRPEDAIEGSLRADDICAALHLRNRALEDCHVEISKMNLTELAAKIQIVLRRYGLSRKQRARG
jgi:hypothetical protein